MINFQYWYDSQQCSYIVGYQTPGLSSINTAICLCTTEKQAVDETNLLNSEQERRTALLQLERDLCARRRIYFGEFLNGR